MSPWIYFNDKLTPAGEAMLHVSDLSIQRGYGVFDFLKVVQGVPLFLNDHLDRLLRSAAFMHLPMPVSKAVLAERVHALIKKAAVVEGGIRLTVTGGYSADGYTISTPNIIIAPQSFAMPLQKDVDKGAVLVTHQYQRQFAAAKTIDYLMGVWLKPSLTANSADDVLYHSDDGITECPRANFFLVTTGGGLVTPDRGILEGITREKIIGCAQRLQIVVETRPVSMHELKRAKGAFVCSTTKGIFPVSRIDGTSYDPQLPVIAALRQALDRVVRQEIDAAAKLADVIG